MAAPELARLRFNGPSERGRQVTGPWCGQSTGRLLSRVVTRRPVSAMRSASCAPTGHSGAPDLEAAPEEVTPV